MTNRFDYFVVFAEMRTGSNFLESNLNCFAGLECYGEAFNPHFVGYPNRDDILGVNLEARSAAPETLLDAIRGQDGVLAGFRFFHDHDPRVLTQCLEDPRCAKIILTRNPIDSYVSWKIAQATGQWKLTDVRRRKDSKITFNRVEFKRHLENLQDFQITLQNGLQTSGQTAFYIAYEDLQDLKVINGLGRYLGQETLLDGLDSSLKRQNPASVAEKVSNFGEITQALSDLDRFNLSRTPNFEPRRGAAVPTYVTAVTAPLLYLPIKSGPEAEVINWLAALDGANPAQLPTSLNQKSLRQWKRASKGHRSFAVVRHPVARAHTAFCQQILAEEGNFTKIRKTLQRVYKVPLPKNDADPGYSVEKHREAFKAYLRFVKANLSGQTGIRTDAHWATQTSQLQGFSNVALPDMVLREDEIGHMLPALATRVGRAKVPPPEAAPVDVPFSLSEVYDAEIETLAGDAYQRDYLTFGFDKWA